MVDGKPIIVTAEVPQRLVLRSTLLNIPYNGVFRIDQGEGKNTVRFADDLALLVRGRDRE